MFASIEDMQSVWVQPLINPCPDYSQKETIGKY